MQRSPDLQQSPLQSLSGKNPHVHALSAQPVHPCPLPKAYSLPSWSRTPSPGATGGLVLTPSQALPSCLPPPCPSDVIFSNAKRVVLPTSHCAPAVNVQCHLLTDACGSDTLGDVSSPAPPPAPLSPLPISLGQPNLTSLGLNHAPPQLLLPPGLPTSVPLTFRWHPDATSSRMASLTSALPLRRGCYVLPGPVHARQHLPSAPHSWPGRPLNHTRLPTPRTHCRPQEHLVSERVHTPL